MKAPQSRAQTLAQDKVWALYCVSEWALAVAGLAMLRALVPSREPDASCADAGCPETSRPTPSIMEILGVSCSSSTPLLPSATTR